MDAQKRDIPACPGCHFGCRLDAYQCARGQKLHASWESGEELPVRGVPWKQPKDGADARAERKDAPARPALMRQMRLMHMLNIVSVALGDHRETRPERQAIDSIARHDGAASAAIVGQRAKLERDQAQELLDGLVGQGLLQAVRAANGTVLFELSPEGKDIARAWREERMAAEAEFCDALDDDEKAQLADLIAKMLGSTAHAGRFQR